MIDALQWLCIVLLALYVANIRDVLGDLIANMIKGLEEKTK